MVVLRMLRTGLVVGIVAVAACASAQVSLIIVSDGVATFTPPTTIADIETVVAQTPADGFLTYVGSYDNASGVGTATYAGTMGTLMINLNLVVPNSIFSPPASKSIDGTWTYAGGTGNFANMSGGGTLALTYLGTGPGVALVGTELSGTLNAVPEPAPFAALGLGALGLLVRRRRHA